MSGNTLPLAPDARSLGKYEVLCRLSTGGMAEIFLASQRGLAGFRKLVVLKQILPDIRGEEEFVRMFLDEAKVTAAFNHPHIAQVYDLDIADGELFLSMEFVPGATLVEVARACRQANHPIPLGYSLMAVRDTAVALHYAHTFTDPLGRPSPVIHRDVAEKNIMVTYEGVTKLLDFGIAKSLARASRTAVGMVKGTSGYMSPEQIMGEPLDARSDLFSLGVVLHECLTGMRLFYAKQAEAMMNAVLKCEVTPPSRTNKQVPPELDAIVMRALSRKREDRYATTLEFARALERAVGPLIWHPEQSSELMLRLFSDRREQTRQLLMAGQAITADATGELNLARVLAMGAEPAEQPTGAANVPAPVPQRPSVAVPTVKGAAQAKPVTPAQGAPAVRRPTVSTPTLPPPPAEVGTVRKAPPAAAQKRGAARTMSGEVARPTPPPSESVAPPVHEQSGARTQPGRPALMPEHTVRAQQITAPHSAAEDTSARLGQRGGVAPEPSTLQDEPVRAPRNPRSTLDGIRAVSPPEAPARGAEEPARARSGRGTLDNLRITPALTPPSPERDAQTAMVRPNAAGAERDLQTAMVRPPAAPMERDLQTAMVRPPAAPVERDLQTAMVRPPAPPSEREAQATARPPAPPLEREAQTPSRQTPPEREGQAQSRQPHADREVQTASRPPPPPSEREAQASRPPPPPSEREAQASRPPPPPSEREAPPAMGRSGLPVEREAQAPSRPAAPNAEREAQASTRPSSPHVEREAHAAMAREVPPAAARPQSSAERAGQRARALPERPEETVSITPTHMPRRVKPSRRRQPPPPPSFPEPELRTEAVRALNSGGDVFPGDLEGAALGDEDAHENTQSGMRAPRREQRSGAMMAIIAVLLLLGGGAVVVILGLDGGRVSAWVKPMLGLEEKGPQGNPPAKPAVAAGTNAPATAPGSGPTPAPGSSPAPVANANPGPGPVDPVTAVDTAESNPDAETKPAEPQALAQDDSPRPDDSPAPKKPSRSPKRTRDTSPKKPEPRDAAGTEAPAASTDSDSAQAAEPGFLTLVTEPYAKVFLGSRELGDTPLFKVKLPSGKQVLKLVDGNGKALKLPVDIKPGETTAVRIPLEMLSRQ